ncbi:MAG: serine/threonine protein kinase, CMGC, CDC2/CDK sub [Watsoniomyces obsoletus]|nr:MAG: serine/threonine protein kinase, CMGC, CDC2/CDK sub [Watsoniomyces obsoletus]
MASPTHRQSLAVTPARQSSMEASGSQNATPMQHDKSQGAKRTLELNGDGRARFRGCSKIKHYEFLSKLGEGTFGEVSKARSLRNKSILALKKIIVHNEKEGFPVTSLREIKILKMLSHPNVLKLAEMVVERNKIEGGKRKSTMYMVTPYMEHDLVGLLENPDVHLTVPQIKCYMMQLLRGVAYLHRNHILHRDMKAANLLISNRGILQIADFGLARHYEGPTPEPGKGNGEAKRDYTGLVVTRWYRSPELLMQLRHYTPAIDMWGVGCVFAEMFDRKAILAGTSDLNQLNMIFHLVGSPTEDNMPGWSDLPGCEGVKTFYQQSGVMNDRFGKHGPLMISLLREFLMLDWHKRINAQDSLKHPYFHTDPLPARAEDLPRFEDSHELDRRRFRNQANPPPAPAGGTGEWSNGDSAAHRRGERYGFSNSQGGYDSGREQGGRSLGPRDAGAGGAARNGHGHDGRQSGRGPPPTRPPPHANNGPGEPKGPPPGRQPAWMRDPPNGAKLPPRPAGPLPPHPAMGGGGGRSDSRGSGGGGAGAGRAVRGPRMDSYVPDYSSEGPRGRERDRDRNRGRDGNGDRDGNRERERERERDRRRSRSRSPRRERGDSASKIRDRDWELYRR